MKKKENYLVLIYLLIFSTIFIMTKFIPFQPDEYNYSNFIWSERRITGIEDIFKSQILMYNLWSGRVIIHFIIQLFLFIGKNTFDVFNALIFLGIIILIKKLSDIKKNGFSTTLIFILLFCFVPIFAETTLWLSGSLNYMWPGFLMMYLLYRLEKKDSFNEQLTVLISFLVGASQENTSLLINTTLLYFILKEYYITKRLNMYFFKNICGSLLGMIFLFGAPGNFKRAGGLGFYLENWIKVTVGNKALFIIIAFLIIINLWLIFFGNRTKKELIKAMEYFIIGIISLIPMVFLREYPVRATYSSYLFFILSLVILLKNFEYKFLNTLIIIVAIIFLPNYIRIISFYNVDLRNQFKRREIELQNLNSGVNFIRPIGNNSNKISSKYLINLYGLYGDLSENPYSIPNFYFAKYYSIEKIFGVRKNKDILKISRVDDSEKMMEVFWDIGNGYSAKDSFAENSYVEPSKNELMKNEAYFMIPSNIKKIRIDLGNQIGLKKILGIEILNENKKLKIESTELKQKIINVNQINKIYLEENILILESTGNDPYIEIEI